MDETRSEGDEEPTDLEEAVVRFALLASAEDGVDLDEYCARFPESWRPELRERCLEVQRLRSDLPKREAQAAGAFPPQRIGGYHIVRELGRGGMGVVFLAHPEDGGVPVAIKVLLINALVTTRAVQRFRREMEATRQLNHPGIVPVLDVGEEAGYLYIVMEYVPGPSLATVLSDRAAAGASRDPDGLLSSGGVQAVSSPNARAAGIAAALADALHAAHEQGLIHRDVKPANILFDADGEPRLFDFGLAKDLSEDSLSLEGELAGTPSYMSPEQALGKRVVIDRRSDVFSLGVVLYEMLAGRRPFGGDSLHELFYAISFKEAPELGKLRPDLPRDLVTIAAKAMEKDPDHRFPSALAMAEDLRRFLNHESIVARPVGRVRNLARRARAHPALSTAVGLLAVVLLALPLLLDWWATRREVQAAIQGAEILIVEARPWRLDEFARALAAVELEEELAALVEAGEADAEAPLEALRSARLDLAERMRVQSRSDAPPPGDTGTRGWTQRRPVYVFIAGLLDGEDPRVALGRAFNAELSVTSEPPGARVIARYLEEDGSYGAPIELGVTPLEGATLEPGALRIVVHAEGHGYAELTRFLMEPAQSYREEVVILPTAELTPGLVRIEPGEFVSGTTEAPPGSARQPRTVAGEGFYVMGDEVSCAQYRAFLLATDREPPRFWPAPYDASWDDLPATGIALDEARACAEWMGMRLPTYDEHQRLGRGTEGRAYPDGSPPADFGLHALSGAPYPAGLDAWAETQERSDALRREYFLAHIQPVGTGPLEGTAGLRHLLGNAREWTETPDFESERLDTDSTPGGLREPLQFFVSGGHIHLASFAFDKLGTADRSYDTFIQGFRCVKSLEP